MVVFVGATRSPWSARRRDLGFAGRSLRRSQGGSPADETIEKERPGEPTAHPYDSKESGNPFVFEGTGLLFEPLPVGCLEIPGNAHEYWSLPRISAALKSTG